VLPDRLSGSLGWSDAHLDVLQLSRVLWVHEKLSHQIPRLLSAGGGEHFQFAAWKSEFSGAGKTNTVNYDNWIDMRMVKPVRYSILAGEPLPSVRDEIRRRMHSWVEPYSQEPNTTQLDMLYAYKSTGHFGAYRSADDGFLDAQLPFYYRRVFEAAFSTDPRFRNNHRLMRHMIQRLDPRIAGVPTTRGGPAEPWRLTNMHRFAPYYRQLGRKAVTKLSDKALGRPLFLDSRSFPWSGAANSSVLERLLLDGSSMDGWRSAPLFRHAELRALLAEAPSATFRQNAMLGRVVTVELALRAAEGT
jgi:hypothetical protein